MHSILKNLLKKGVVKGNSQILSEIELKELESLINKNCKDSLKQLGVFNNIVGIDKRIDELLEKIISNQEIKDILLKLLGKNYLLRHVSARYNKPDDKGLAMHQDSLGEVSMTILVNNQTEGSTFFFPGSQLIPSNKNLAEKVSWNSLKLIILLKFFLIAASGKAGSYYYFFNRTWHGRLPGKKNNTNLSLFFAFFPVSANRKYLITDDYEYNSKFELDLIERPNLKKILSRKNYNFALENFKKVKNADSLSKKINKINIILKNVFYFIFVILKLFFLEIVFFPIKIKTFLKLKK